jgi:DNA helicase-2/ATP-dependent DNA helicase PcrA
MTDPEAVLERLNPEQRDAARATTGPVAILAGAGTGKTTTITHRIAHQVATGTFRAEQILTVTFTEKAAGELKARLQRLGVAGVEARTFHSAALSQLHRLWAANTGEPLPQVLDSKAPLISSLANALPMPHKFVPRRDLAGEIEWAKNRMIPAERYLAKLGDHVPPIPAELMERVYSGYERRKRAMGRLDFEDMLGLAVQLLSEHPEAIADVQARYAAFTVDEYQDVNPLQYELLSLWLGGRDEVCVVGDDYQTIYGFTGASPRYLLDFEDRYPNAHVVRLEQSYRSTPQVLEAANRLAAQIDGFRKTLRTDLPEGPEPVIAGVADEGREVAKVLERVRALHGEGVAFEEMAVLYRINARSEPFEEAFADAGIPFQVRDGAFLRRPAPRAALQALRRATGPVLESMVDVTARMGFDPETEPDSEEEVTRQADMARLRELAREFQTARPDDGLPEFVAELTRRFSTEETARGVNLLTYHRAKGLEFEAVFLPRLLDGELPFRSGRSKAPVDEERRLLYVGITRARRWLYLSWPWDAKNGRSPFVEEISPTPDVRPPKAGSATRGKGPPVTVPPGDADLFETLKRWRLERSKADGVPAYVVFHNTTLESIATRRPRSNTELLAIPGTGPTKLERYGDEVLAIVAAEAEL